MATLWHYRRAEAELGPVGFQELVKLVRAEQLSVDALVREDWNDEWRPAALAVGLFHMAGRDDLVAQWEAEQAELRRREEEARLAASGAVAVEEEAWEKRLRELEAERIAEERAQLEEREAERAANATRTEIDDTLAAALAEIEDRERAQLPTRWQRLWRTAFSQRTAHWLVRWVPTLIVPNLVAWWILQWSDLQLQRFPSRQAMEQQQRHFPMFGECEPTMFFFLMFDALLFSAVAIYLMMAALDRRTDG